MRRKARAASWPLIGAHVSAAGGVANAPAIADEIGAEAMQVFTRNQRMWAARPLKPEEPAAFREALAKSGVRAVMAHASYLVNLAATSDEFLRKSRDTMVDEVERCQALGIPDLVVHPGAHLGAGEAAGLRRVAESLDEITARTASSDVRVLLEVTAGQGTCLGHRFEHLRDVLAQVRAPARVGVCLDSCHLLAAGFDLTDADAYERMMESLQAHVGVERVRAMHLNDARDGVGSHRDRHARAGEGTMGLDTFRRILGDRRLRHVPMVVENPGPLESWQREIALLRKLSRAA